MKVTLSERKGNKVEALRRLAVSLGALAVIILFSVFAPPQTELFDKVGMALAILALAIFLCRFPVGAYLMANLLTVCAAAGSILKFYDRFPGYDRVVHFISGLILGYIGVYLVRWLFGRLSLYPDPFVVILFAGLFSFACAGFLEIIEFLTDCVMHMGVQHGNTDTMGDIVAGYLGGVCFQLHKLFESRKFFTKDRIHSFFKGEILPAGKDEKSESEKIPAGKV